MVTNLRQLSESLNLRYQGDGDLPLTHVCGMEDPAPGGVGYLDMKPAIGGVDMPADTKKKLSSWLDRLDPGMVVIAREGFDRQHTHTIFADSPVAAHADAARLLHPAKEPEWQIHPTVIQGRGVKLGKNVRLGPGVVLYDGVTIGDHTCLEARVVVMSDCLIGRDCHIYPGVVVREDTRIGDRCIVHAGAVLGTDGHGYYQEGGQNRKIPQVGHVEIGDDVEIGSCTTIDRGRMRTTRIGDGCKIDNQVQIGHNVQLGRHALIAAQCGLAGSSTIGDHLILGGQCGVKDHVQLGNHVTAVARTGILASVRDRTVLGGMPARPLQQWRTAQMLINRLEGFFQRLTRLEKRMNLPAGEAPAAASQAERGDR